MNIYTYLLVDTNARWLTGDEANIKKLWASKVNRLFRILGGVAWHSCEEFNGTGWVETPKESM